MKRLSVLMVVLVIVLCSGVATQPKDESILSHIMSCVDSNLNKVRSGEVTFTIRREPTSEGRMVLPKAAKQFLKEGFQGADSILLEDLVVEEIVGRMVFSGTRFRIEARVQRDEKFLMHANTNHQKRSVIETPLWISFDGKRFAYLSSTRQGFITDKMEMPVPDLRVPHVLSICEHPSQPGWVSWSQTLRRAYDEGRLQLVRLESQAPRRIFVVKLLETAPRSDRLPSPYRLIYFKEEWGCMPAKIETYDVVPYQGRVVEWKKSESSVERVVPTGTGGWFPSFISEVTWGGELGAPVTSPLVPVKRSWSTIELSKPNARYSNKVFAPSFPPGTFVTDKLSNTYYVVRHPLVNVPTGIGALFMVVSLVGFIVWRIRSLKKQQ
ncbi:MAG: hypothetical protein KatS3mg022_2769 [Armatimonadota bacterium]|nr:MAG: hypothetical protein KatS3mg022_2769 [Armatimonadota bacterium]